MPLTPRFQLEYPTEEQDPWYGPFQALVLNFDQNLYAQLERQNVILIVGGSCSLNTTTDTFSWSAEFELLAATCGRVAEVPIGGITLRDGEALYVELPRPLTVSGTVTMKTASSLGTDQRRQLVGVRRGESVYLVNNQVVVGSP